MTNDLPPRRTGAVRTRLLSVTGVVVVGVAVGSLLLWHAQLGDMLGLAADKEPVVSSVSAPAVGAPPADDAGDHRRRPAARHSPSTPSKTPTTPKPPKKTVKTPKPSSARRASMGCRRS